MLEGCNSFNGDLSKWDVSKVTSMEYTLKGATAFNKKAWCTPSWNNVAAMYALTCAVSGRVFCCNAGTYLHNLDPYAYTGKFPIAPSTDDIVSGDNPSTGGPGTWTMASPAACLKCPAGQYTDGLNLATTCTACAKNKIAPQAGSTACGACNVADGAWSNVASFVAVTSINAGIVASAAFSPAPVVGDMLHIEHAPGKTCGTTGVFSVTAADSATGYTLGIPGMLAVPNDVTDASLCIIGIPSTSCQVCPAGQFTQVDQKYITDPGKTVCVPCGKGKFQDVGTETSCKECATGEYQSEVQKPFCLPCIPGEYQNLKGQE